MGSLLLLAVESVGEDWILRVSGVLTAVVVIVAAFQRAFIWQVRQTRDAVREELAVTFRGLEDRLDGLARAQELHAAAQRDDSRRIARLERQIDEILHISADTIVPRQTDIARKLDIRDEES